MKWTIEHILFSEIDFWVHEKALVTLGNNRQYVLSFLRLMSDCLKPVHQFEESILKYSTTEYQRKWSHFDGILSWPFQKRMIMDLEQKHFMIAWNNNERVLSDVERLFAASKHVHKTIERILHESDSFPCFNECIHFRSFSWTFFTG